MKKIKWTIKTKQFAGKEKTNVAAVLDEFGYINAQLIQTAPYELNALFTIPEGEDEPPLDSEVNAALIAAVDATVKMEIIK